MVIYIIYNMVHTGRSDVILLLLLVITIQFRRYNIMLRLNMRNRYIIWYALADIEFFFPSFETLFRAYNDRRYTANKVRYKKVFFRKKKNEHEGCFNPIPAGHRHVVAAVNE